MREGWSPTEPRNSTAAPWRQKPRTAGPVGHGANGSRFRFDPSRGGRGLAELSQVRAETVYPLIHIHMDTNIIRRDAEIRNFLQQKLGGGDIAAEVAQEALACDDVTGFFDDLSRYGCVCGMV